MGAIGTTHTHVLSISPNEPPPEGLTLSSFIVSFLPLLLLLPLFVVLLRMVKRSTKTQQRSFVHMDRMEEKTDRVIALLESIHEAAKREK